MFVHCVSMRFFSPFPALSLVLRHTHRALRAAARAPSASFLCSSEAGLTRLLGCAGSSVPRGPFSGCSRRVSLSAGHWASPVVTSPAGERGLSRSIPSSCRIEALGHGSVAVAHCLAAPGVDPSSRSDQRAEPRLLPWQADRFP